MYYLLHHGLRVYEKGTAYAASHFFETQVLQPLRQPRQATFYFSGPYISNPQAEGDVDQISKEEYPHIPPIILVASNARPDPVREEIAEEVKNHSLCQIETEHDRTQIQCKFAGQHPMPN